MPTIAPDNWFTAVTAADLDLHGVTSQEGESPTQTIKRVAEESDVALNDVGRCLALLRDGRCLLSGGAPFSLLAYSPRRGVYRASFDGDCSEDLAALSLASAGVWLTLLAGEIGELPPDDQHWLIARLTDTGVVARNPYVQGLANGYASQAPMPVSADASTGCEYEQLIGRALWRCVSHCLR